MGFYTGVIRIGTLVAVLFGGILSDGIGFRSTALLLAGITLLVGLGALFVQTIRTPAEAEPEAAPTSPEKPPSGSAVLHVPRRRVWAVYGASFVNGAAGSSLAVATLGLWLLERYEDGIHLVHLQVGVATFTGVLLAFRFLADVVWAPSAGRLSDRLGRTRFMGTSGLVVVTSLIALSVDGGLGWTVGTALSLFVAGTALRVCLDAAAGDLAPPALRSRVMSWYANWSDFGAAIGPFVAYQLATEVGLTWVYRGGAASLAIAGVVAVAVLRARPGRAD
jgi:MFS family permease